MDVPAEQSQWRFAQIRKMDEWRSNFETTQ
jgi:hypothetical protein